MVLNILRVAFITLFIAVTLLYVLTFQTESLHKGVPAEYYNLILPIALGVALVLVALDIYVKNKKLAALSGVFLGLIAGLVAAYALSFVVDLFGLLTMDHVVDQRSSPTIQRAHREAYLNLLQGVKVMIGLITCYISISMVLQTKDDFRFVIPYVEFAKELRGSRPTLLDTSVVIDGRILDIIQTRIVQGSLIVPRFVLNELQLVADASDKLKRARGRRGLEILQKLQENHTVDVHIEEVEVEGAGVDQKLVALAQQTQARIMTNDYNLNKIATLRGVEVINLNDLAKALRPVVLPGESMTVKVIKPGESPTQAVGYLDDGTMVVVENARSLMGQEVDMVVTSTLQTSAGRMIFGRLSETAENHREAEPTPAAPATPVAITTAPPTDKPLTPPIRRPTNRRNPRR